MSFPRPSQWGADDSHENNGQLAAGIALEMGMFLRSDLRPRWIVEVSRRALIQSRSANSPAQGQIESTTNLARAPSHSQVCPEASWQLRVAGGVADGGGSLDWRLRRLDDRRGGSANSSGHSMLAGSWHEVGKWNSLRFVIGEKMPVGGDALLGGAKGCSRRCDVLRK